MAPQKPGHRRRISSQFGPIQSAIEEKDELQMCEEEMFFEWGDAGCAPLLTRPLSETSSAVISQLSQLTSLDSALVKELKGAIQFFEESQAPVHLSSADICTALGKFGVPCCIRESSAGSSSNCFKQLRHSFVVVTTTEGKAIFIDPFFNEQFQLPRSDAVHNEIIKSLPAVFVGTAEKLLPMVKLISEQTLKGLDRLGLHRPPWRNVDALLSKWLPNRFNDVVLSTPANSRTPMPSSFMSVALTEKLLKLRPIIRRQRTTEPALNVPDLDPTSVILGFIETRQISAAPTHSQILNQ